MGTKLECSLGEILSDQGQTVAKVGQWWQWHSAYTSTDGGSRRRRSAAAGVLGHARQKPTWPTSGGPPRPRNQNPPGHRPLTPSRRTAWVQSGSGSGGEEQLLLERVCQPAPAAFSAFPAGATPPLLQQHPAPACLTTTLVQQEHPGGAQRLPTCICPNMIWPMLL